MNKKILKEKKNDKKVDKSNNRTMYIDSIPSNEAKPFNKKH